MLQLIARGYVNKQIARDFRISEQSTKNYVSRILKKLEVVNRTEAVVKASQSGLISLDAETVNTLYELIRSGRPLDRGRNPGNSKGITSQAISATPAQALYHLKQIQRAFAEVERQLQIVIQIIDEASDGHN